MVPVHDALSFWYADDLLQNAVDDICEVAIGERIKLDGENKRHRLTSYLWEANPD